MIILRPALETQNITIIPRYAADTVTVSLRNKMTQEIIEDEVNATYENGYMNFSISLQPNDKEDFEINVYDGETLLYRGKCFATDQTDLENYKLSN